jgi:hypothetical protein
MSSAAVARRTRREQKILVFNPSLYTDSVEAGGVTYHFEPGGYATCACAAHNVRGHEDNVGVHAGYDWPRDSKNKLVTDQPRKVAGGGEMTADACAELIVSPAVRGQKFFVIVEGSDLERRALEQEAKRKWADAYAEEVDIAITGWERELRELQLSQPGALPPRQPQRIQDAYKFRRAMQRNEVDRGAYVCTHCGADYDAEAAYTAHIVEDHPGVAAERGLKRPERVLEPLPVRVAKANAAKRPQIGDEEVPAGEGAGAEMGAAEEGDSEDEDDETETGEALFARAKRTGVNMTGEDREALLANDPAIRTDVRKRIRAIRDERARLHAEREAKRRGGAAAQPQG